MSKQPKTRRGVYLTGEQRRELYLLLRLHGFTLSQVARLLRYSLREAYDLAPEITARAEEAALFKDIQKLKNGKDQT